MSGSYSGPSGAGNAFAANAAYNASGATGTGAGGGATSTFDDANRTVQYACGDCDAKVQLKKGDPIRCKECGHRVLYKERTNRMVQFEAR